MNNMINSGNTQTHSAHMSEKELLNDLLTQEKHLFGIYSNSVLESACVQLRDILMNNMNALSQDQFNIFDQMAKRGYYPQKAATPQDVQQAKTTAGQTQSQLH